ncbi:MAG TPA: GNAT family N-acetyltransferase [Nitrososphaeraceae archaeon]|jgi:ribosomal protein S18 acetylase RimI-like enzyme
MPYHIEGNNNHNGDGSLPKQQQKEEQLLHPHHTGVMIRNTIQEDIPKIINLQKESFPYLARYDNIWRPEELESHLRTFPKGQFVAIEPDGTIVGSASTLIVFLNPEYAEHTWKDITANGLFTNHNPKGDSLYGADISTHPKYRHEGIGNMLYGARKQLVRELNLRRMIGGGRLFNYCEYASRMSALEYAQKVIRRELRDPVLSFQLDNEFKFVKILSNYLDDVRSLNYASFIEWVNPKSSS